MPRDASLPAGCMRDRCSTMYIQSDVYIIPSECKSFTYIYIYMYIFSVVQKEYTYIYKFVLWYKKKIYIYKFVLWYKRIEKYHTYDCMST